MRLRGQRVRTPAVLAELVSCTLASERRPRVGRFVNEGKAKTKQAAAASTRDG